MFSTRIFGRLVPSSPSSSTMLACALALGMGVAACGSDKDTGTKASDPNAVVTADTSVVNSDAKGTEPTIATKSAVTLTQPGGKTASMAYAQVIFNPNATAVEKSFGVNFNDYDACTFGFNHGYKGFPTGNFNFFGVYLVNGTPGAPLAQGTYTLGATTGMYIEPNASGSGYDFTDCKAGGGYAKVESGTVEIVTLTTPATGKPTFAGNIDVTMVGGSTFKGTFTTSGCKNGTNNTPPVQPAADPYTCSNLSQ